MQGRSTHPHAAPGGARDAPGVHASVPRRAADHQALVLRALQEPWRQAAVLAVLPARKHLRPASRRISF